MGSDQTLMNVDAEHFIERCDPDRPLLPHQSDCNIFYQCNQVRNGGVNLIEQSCEESLMFNPISMVCDFDYNVLKMRPECKTKEKPTDQAELLNPEDLFGSKPADEPKNQKSTPSISQGVDDEAILGTGALKPEKLSVKPIKEGEECSDTANATPHVPHESDCSKFYHCVPTHVYGGKLVLKNCSKGTLF